MLRTEYQLKRIALAAAGAALAGLTACSHSAAPAAAPASRGHAPVPVSCSQRYHTWEQRQGKGLIATLDTVSSTVAAGDTQKLTSALKKAKPAVALAARRPIPACADPMGYWNVLLMHVNAGAASTSSKSSMRAAMKDVPQIAGKLAAELQHIAH